MLSSSGIPQGIWHMDDAREIRSLRVRGSYHRELAALLNQKVAEDGGVTQASIGSAVDMHPSTVGGILRKDEGTFDLDEADAALRHVGSTLKDFVMSRPPRPLTEAEELARALETRPALRDLVKALLPVPKTRLAAVVAFVRNVGPLASGRHGGSKSGPTNGTPSAARTKSAPKQRRVAPAHKARE
jgi:hypothetical protein